MNHATHQIVTSSGDEIDVCETDSTNNGEILYSIDGLLTVRDILALAGFLLTHRPEDGAYALDPEDLRGILEAMFKGRDDWALADDDNQLENEP